MSSDGQQPPVPTRLAADFAGQPGFQPGGHRRLSQHTARRAIWRWRDRQLCSKVPLRAPAAAHEARQTTAVDQPGWIRGPWARAAGPTGAAASGPSRPDARAISSRSRRFCVMGCCPSTSPADDQLGLPLAHLLGGRAEHVDAAVEARIAVHGRSREADAAIVRDKPGSAAALPNGTPSTAAAASACAPSEGGKAVSW